MPVMDGITSAKLILESQVKLLQEGFNLPQIKIVPVSAYSDEETRKKCLDAGM